jgi:hypothetical protein
MREENGKKKSINKAMKITYPYTRQELMCHTSFIDIASTPEVTQYRLKWEDDHEK